MMSFDNVKYIRWQQQLCKKTYYLEVDIEISPPPLNKPNIVLKI